MARMIDQIRASKLPSNMMQFAARGALAVSPAENIEILVHLARHNKVFGDLARMTLAGWDEKASMAVASDPNTPAEVLEYLLSPDNLRPKLLPALLENSSVREDEIVKFGLAASRESVTAMLQSARVKGSKSILDALKSNPYVKTEEMSLIENLLNPASRQAEGVSSEQPTGSPDVTADEGFPAVTTSDPAPTNTTAVPLQPSAEPPDEEVSAYLTQHAADVAAEEGKPFQAIGGLHDLLRAEETDDGEPDEPVETAPQPAAVTNPATAAKPATPAKPPGPHKKPQPPGLPKRENTLQKINNLDVKGRIQLALKGNKEERSILIRDGTKVVALAVLEAPKLADGEVEKFASQKNVLEAVLRQIPLKRRFMKNYIVVRNLVFNPRTPLDLSLNLMKNLLTQDLKNLSANKEVSETIRKLALKMYKQKLEAANKK